MSEYEISSLKEQVSLFKFVHQSINVILQNYAFIHRGQSALAFLVEILILSN